VPVWPGVPPADPFVPEPCEPEAEGVPPAVPGLVPEVLWAPAPPGVGVPVCPPGGLDDPLAPPEASPGGRGHPWGAGCEAAPGDCDPCADGWPLDPGCPCDGLLEPEPPLGDFCGGNGDSLPLPPWLGLGLELVLGLPPELDGDEEGGDEELGGCGEDGDCDVTAQPARAPAQAAVIRSRVMCS